MPLSIKLIWFNINVRNCDCVGLGASMERKMFQPFNGSTNHSPQEVHPKTQPSWRGLLRGHLEPGVAWPHIAASALSLMLRASASCICSA